MAEEIWIRATAPGRAGVVGNPTDGYGGTVISSSIAERAWCEVRSAESWTIEIGGASQAVKSPADLALRGDNADVARAVLQRLWPVPPSALTAGTTIPIRAGLSGSTAILTSILAALLRRLDRSLTRYEVAELARSIEFDTLGITCGFQDQYMIAFGGLNYMDFRGKEPGASNPPWATLEPLERAAAGAGFILAHTGVQRVSGVIHKGLRERWMEGDRAVRDGYLQIAGLAREGKKAFLRAEWDRLGALMNENHAIQRDLGGSGEANEKLIAAALDSGALGAKLAGAGGGGTIIALFERPAEGVDRLDAVGAERVWRVEPGEGLTVESRSTESRSTSHGPV
jgi:galactokinase/mevalonate kinase-like predicted kinase